MSSPDQKTPIYLFLSKDCKNCIDLINEIKKKPELAKNIQAIPIETAPRLPPNLTHVPTILENGKMMVGKDCFEWVKNYGELEAGPLINTKGMFDNSNYSFIGSNDSASTMMGGGVGGAYSFLGQTNGSEGIDPNQVNAKVNAESQGAQLAKNSTMRNFEQLQQQRDKDIGNMNNGNNKQNPMMSY